MITASWRGFDALLARFEARPAALRAALAETVAAAGARLRERVARKLSGEALQQRSGRLAAGISVAVEARGDAAAAALASDQPYAAIHEYGGTIPPHAVLPAGARALAFPWQGRQRFFRRVQLPAVTMPERSFLRAALAELAPELTAATAAALRREMQP